MNDLLLFLANARVVDVVVVLGDGTLVAGYPSKVSLGQESGLVLTAQGAIPGVGHDTTIDLESVVWAWATSDDGSQQTFGTRSAELAGVLGGALAEAKAADPRGADAARLEIALGAVAHATGDLAAADRYYRGATSKLVMLGADSRTLGDLWMRLVGVYAEMDDPEALRAATEQAVAFYTSAFGENDPRVVHARGVQAALTCR
jgi:hypothetical protein